MINVLVATAQIWGSRWIMNHGGRVCPVGDRNIDKYKQFLGNLTMERSDSDQKNQKNVRVKDPAGVQLDNRVPFGGVMMHVVLLHLFGIAGDFKVERRYQVGQTTEFFRDDKMMPAWSYAWCVALASKDYREQRAIKARDSLKNAQNFVWYAIYVVLEKAWWYLRAGLIPKYPNQNYKLLPSPLLLGGLGEIDLGHYQPVWFAPFFAYKGARAYNTPACTALHSSSPRSYDWDFPLFAMNVARLRVQDRAVQFLLDSSFQLDDFSYLEPTSYFPSSSCMLLALGMTDGGWSGDNRSQFPDEWTVEAEGSTKAF